MSNPRNILRLKVIHPLTEGMQELGNINFTHYLIFLSVQQFVYVRCRARQTFFLSAFAVLCHLDGVSIGETCSREISTTSALLAACLFSLHWPLSLYLPRAWCSSRIKNHPPRDINLPLGTRRQKHTRHDKQVMSYVTAHAAFSLYRLPRVHLKEHGTRRLAV